MEFSRLGNPKKICPENSDQAILNELGRRLARSRLNRNQSQADLAAEAGISLRTLHRIEHGQSTHLTNLIRLLRALDLLENMESLIPAPGLSPMQLLALGGKERKRASSSDEAQDESRDDPNRSNQPDQSDQPDQSNQPWAWGDDE